MIIRVIFNIFEISNDFFEELRISNSDDGCGWFFDFLITNKLI